MGIHLLALDHEFDVCEVRLSITLEKFGEVLSQLLLVVRFMHELKELWVVLPYTCTHEKKSEKRREEEKEKGSRM